jgi:uncharacterized membrane protein
MLGIRVVGIIAILVIGGALAAYFITRKPGYLRLATRTLKLAVLVVVLLLLVLAVERL